MRLQADPPLHLTYCLNIHPGERWDENFAAIETHACRVRDRVAGGLPFGLGLRLGNAAAQELAAPAALRAFREFLAAEGLYVFTINGFPYGQFHGARVKEDVYRPDWRTPERLRYTCVLADILAALLPEGVTGSISTAPGSYGAWIGSDADVAAMADGLLAAAEHLARLRESTGRHIQLALEPEPDCYLQRVEDVVAFFEGPLQRAGRGDAVRAHLGACVDTCHAALAFEDPLATVRRLERAGIAVAKVQLSAAVRARPTPGVLAQLRGFCDPVYLHQTRIRRPGGAVEGHPDLAPALDALADGCPADTEVRVHFHVPVYWEGDCQSGDCPHLRTGAEGPGRRMGTVPSDPNDLVPLSSTASLLTPGFWSALREGACEHVEIETYTFDLLPDVVGKPDVVDAVAREYAWVLARLLPSDA